LDTNKPFFWMGIPGCLSGSVAKYCRLVELVVSRTRKAIKMHSVMRVLAAAARKQASQARRRRAMILRESREWAWVRGRGRRM
jgi:hypothetical protein